jgi:hypothetical protein
VGALLTAPRNPASIQLFDLGLGWWAVVAGDLVALTLLVLHARAVGRDRSP